MQTGRGLCAPLPLRRLGVLRLSTNCGVDFTDRRPESLFNQNREESFRPLHSAGVVFAEPSTVAVAN